MMMIGFNPFGTGQCLSTGLGSVLGDGSTFQSLWNRAMSFDVKLSEFDTLDMFQSRWNRAMSFDCSRVFEPCVARLPRATSQLFLMFE